MLINFSDIATPKFTPKQFAELTEKFGHIVHITYPKIDIALKAEEIYDIVKQYISTIDDMITNNANCPCDYCKISMDKYNYIYNAIHFSIQDAPHQALEFIPAFALTWVDSHCTALIYSVFEGKNFAKFRYIW